AVAEGLVNGVDDENMQPQGTATRAQVATIFQRFTNI
ncbi:MAG TPA: S-layer homology domain-containing protein, partial [Firmicutes bacterium]|nr:S-layer homology domain-containing protein [Bacillota bacterium]